MCRRRLAAHQPFGCCRDASASPARRVIRQERLSLPRESLLLSLRMVSPGLQPAGPCSVNCHGKAVKGPLSEGWKERWASQYSNNITAVAAASKTEGTKEWAVQGLGAAHEVLLPRSLRALAGSRWSGAAGRAVTGMSCPRTASDEYYWVRIYCSETRTPCFGNTGSHLHLFAREGWSSWCG